MEIPRNSGIYIYIYIYIYSHFRRRFVTQNETIDSCPTVNYIKKKLHNAPPPKKKLQLICGLNNISKQNLSLFENNLQTRHYHRIKNGQKLRSFFNEIKEFDMTCIL